MLGSDLPHGTLDLPALRHHLLFPDVDLDVMNDATEIHQLLIAYLVVLEQGFVGGFVMVAAKPGIRGVKGNALRNNLSPRVEADLGLRRDKPFDQPDGGALIGLEGISGSKDRRFRP
jgi:hypothetical protein